jgi:hypothetical protein
LLRRWQWIWQEWSWIERLNFGKFWSNFRFTAFAVQNAKVFLVGGSATSTLFRFVMHIPFHISFGSQGSRWPLSRTQWFMDLTCLGSCISIWVLQVHGVVISLCESLKDQDNILGIVNSSPRDLWSRARGVEVYQIHKSRSSKCKCFTSNLLWFDDLESPISGAWDVNIMLTDPKHSKTVILFGYWNLCCCA